MMLMATVTALQIGPADHGRTMTLDEFLEAEEVEGYRYELARGVLEVTQVPNDPHGLIVFNLYNALAHYHRNHPGHIHRFGGAGEFQLRLPGLVSGRNPDAAVVLKGTPPDSRRRRPAALAIEVVSAGGEARDYVTKREEYLAYGLREYWIVDPHTNKITVLIREGDVWIEHICQGDQPIPSLVLPGFAATVAELLAEAEPDEPLPG
jgi:Uma2 family endonuclease